MVPNTRVHVVRNLMTHTFIFFSPCKTNLEKIPRQRGINQMRLVFGVAGGVKEKGSCKRFANGFKHQTNGATPPGKREMPREDFVGWQLAYACLCNARISLYAFSRSVLWDSIISFSSSSASFRNLDEHLSRIFAKGICSVSEAITPNT